MVKDHFFDFKKFNNFNLFEIKSKNIKVNKNLKRWSRRASGGGRKVNFFGQSNWTI